MIEGVYGPTDLADWIAINNKPELFIQIHRLFELVEKSAILKNRTREIERLTGERDDLASHVQRLEDELRFANEQIDTLINMQIQSNDELRQTKEIVQKTYTELKTSRTHLDLASVQQTATEISNQLRVIDSTNHSTGTIEFKLYFYRAKAVANRIWLGCACGEEQNVLPRIPKHSDIVFERIVNSRDQYEYIKNELDEFIFESNYRHLLIDGGKINVFFDTIDRILDKESIHKSVRQS